ncbi:MAG TPA: helix-turn-helix transcriptional regulator [Thermoguttaceae bacterium]
MTKLPYKTNAGPVLRTIMESRELTFTTVAARAGIHRSSLYRMLNGKTDFHLSTLVEIANALGYEVQVVMKDKEEKV